MQAGGAEDHVMVQSLQIVRPQAEPAPCILQLTAQGTQGLPVLFVAGGNIDSCVQKELQKRAVADSDTGHSHPFTS